jgi:hypothetical protein
MWSALEATNRSKPQQPDVLERLRSRSSDRWQQTAARARALQAGGRPFEPATAHRHAKRTRGRRVPATAVASCGGRRAGAMLTGPRPRSVRCPSTR